MTAKDRYATAAAFRRALEQRLRTEAQTAAIPLTRLRKEAAFYRLLARLNTVAPTRWAFKGGLSLIARLGEQVRGTKDADANWRATRAELEETLSAVEGVDLDDWFIFTIGDAHEMLGEADGGALRYPSNASLDGRLFEQLHLDINIVGALDPRPVELVTLERHIFEFIGEPPLQLPMVTPAQQLAEKLHALVRTYDGEQSSRAKDLFDMLLIADLVRLPNAVALVEAARQTFRVRAATWPPRLTHPPRDWTQPWQGYVREYPTRWADVTAAFTALRQFWEPLFEERSTDAHWNPAQWRWIRH